MTDAGPITLLRTAVVPLATAAVHRARTVAVVAAVLGALCLVAGVADMVASSSPPTRNDGAAIVWVGIFAAVAVLAMRRAKRVARTAERAAADAGSSWTLVGKLVVATDDRGVPAPDLSFKVTGAQRAMLLAGPRKTADPTRRAGDTPTPMTTAEIRTRLLASCDGVDAFGSHKAVRAGLFAATQAVRDEPVRDDPRAWLAAVLVALATVRKQFVDPADDDGWALGGVATIRNLVEAELARLG